MPDPTPIPSASALARAVEASERNRDEIWNEAIEAATAAAESHIATYLTVAGRILSGNRDCEMAAEAVRHLLYDLRVLRREPTDAG